MKLLQIAVTSPPRFAFLTILPTSSPACHTADAGDGRSNLEANNPSTSGNTAASPSISFWYRLNRIILRLCSTHQFKNLQVSRLQRQFTIFNAFQPVQIKNLSELNARLQLWA